MPWGVPQAITRKAHRLGMAAVQRDALDRVDVGP